MNLDQYTHSTTSGQDVFLMPKSVVNLSPKDINTAFHLQRKKSPGIVVLGNLRNVGWMMTRTRDDADVDFRDLNTLEVDTPFKIHFVHGNGYCAAVETDNPLALIEKLTQQK